MKKYISVLLTLVMAMSLVACTGGSKKADLVMATNAEFQPYEFRDADNNIVGIDVEICQAIADELGRNLVIEDMAFDSIITSVYTGKADLGAAGMTITEDRLQSIDFSIPYATATQVIIVPNDSEITSPDDLVGKKIGVQLGTTGDIYSEDIEDAEIERYNKGYEAVQALIQGKIDAVIIDNEPAKVYVGKNPELKIVDEAFTYEEYAIAISKNNPELLAEVNAAITKLKESGKLDEIVNKYIAADN